MFAFSLLPPLVTSLLFQCSGYNKPQMFPSRMLHTFACQKSGCLYLRTQPNVEQSLQVGQYLFLLSSVIEDTK